LTTQKPADDRARSTERPAAAKSEWVTRPTLAPTAETSATRRPRVTPRVSTRMLSGPGATMTTSEAVRNRTIFVSPGTTPPRYVLLHRHALGEVARLVYVEAPVLGEAIRE
jgi:hypothetical protein